MAEDLVHGSSVHHDAVTHADITRPFLLAFFDDSTRAWSMSDQAKAILAALPGEKRIRSIGVAGIMRQGKSYLMNRFAGVQDGFELGSYTVGKTRGIWAWFPPRLNPEGCELLTMLLDTEGLADPARADPTHDAQMLVLTTMLSSVLIYNFLGAPNEEVLEKLAFTSEMTKLVHVKMRHPVVGSASSGAAASVTSPASGPATSGTRSSHFKAVFPRLVFLARDFFLRFPPETPTKEAYFAQLMAPRSAPASASDHARRVTQAANATRGAILDMFPSVELATLPRPVVDDEDLLVLETLDESALKPKFLAAVNAFVAEVLDSASVRLIRPGGYALDALQGAVPLTPRVLQLFLTSMLQAFTTGAVPNLANEVDNISETLCSAAAASAFRGVMEANAVVVADLPVDMSTMQARMQPVLDAAAAAYAAQAMGSAAEKHRRALQDRLVDWQNAHHAANQDASRQKTTATYKAATVRLRTDLDAGVFADYAAFLDAARVYVQEAELAAGELGPAAEQVLASTSAEQTALNEYAMAVFRLNEAECERRRVEQLAEEDRQRRIAEAEQHRQQLEHVREETRQTQKQLQEMQKREEATRAQHGKEIEAQRLANEKAMADLQKQGLEAVAAANARHQQGMAKLASDMQKNMKELSDKHAKEMQAANARLAEAQAARGGGGGGGGFCFSSATKVTMGDGTEREVSHLLPGDTVLAVDDAGGVFADTVAFCVPRHVSAVLTITLDCGAQVTVTPDHLVCTYVRCEAGKPGPKLQPIAAAKITVGDCMAYLGADSDAASDVLAARGAQRWRVRMHEVVRVETTRAHVTTMLTHTGRVVANGIAASCHTGSETVGQVLAWPLRQLQRWGGASAVHSWPVLAIFEMYEKYIGY